MTDAVSCNTNFRTIPSPLEAFTGRKLRTSLPQIPLAIEKPVESSRICQELIKCQQPSSTSTSSYRMDLKPGQPFFIKEVQGNIWKTGTIDQPAKEPDSYWVRFPDDSILRRTHQMIKPRSLPSHFELESAAKERNSTEFITSGAFSSFQSMLPALEQPALQTGNPMALPTRKDIPISSLGVTQPSIPEKKQPFYENSSTKEILSIQDLIPVVLCCGTQWKVFHFKQ